MLVVLTGAAAWAQAQDSGPCYADVPLQKRVAACTAIIENPASESWQRAEAYASRGQAYSMYRHYAEGLTDLDKALELDPRSAFALNNRAWAYFKWQQSAKGLPDVEKSLDLAPGYAAAWDTRAHLRQLLGRFEDAFSDYELAVGLGGAAFVRLYQCGLRERGLFNGTVDGVYSHDTREALKSCAHQKSCDPLPENGDYMPDIVNCGDKMS